MHNFLKFRKNKRMKKILIALTVLLGISFLSISQDKKPKETPKNAISAKSAVTTKSSVKPPTKKDGTPDMRYKENKTVPKKKGK